MLYCCHFNWQSTFQSVIKPQNEKHKRNLNTVKLSYTLFTLINCQKGSVDPEGQAPPGLLAAIGTRNW